MPSPELHLPASPRPYAAFDIVAIAASFGGLRAISGILSALPSDFPAAIVIVQHLNPRTPSFIGDILSRRTRLRVKEAREGEALCVATVYVAPPGRHLLVNPEGDFSLALTPKVHWVRPAADLLFESVAVKYMERAIAVVLTGKLCDGAVGVEAIKRMGGRVLVQNPNTAEASGMPRAAIRTGCVDFVLSPEKIASALITLVTVRGALVPFPSTQRARMGGFSLPSTSGKGGG